MLRKGQIVTSWISAWINPKVFLREDKSVYRNLEDACRNIVEISRSAGITDPKYFQIDSNGEIHGYIIDKLGFNDKQQMMSALRQLVMDDVYTDPFICIIDEGAVYSIKVANGDINVGSWVPSELKSLKQIAIDRMDGFYGGFE